MIWRKLYKSHGFIISVQIEIARNTICKSAYHNVGNPDENKWVCKIEANLFYLDFSYR